MAAFAGYLSIDFDETSAFRDSVDEGSATEIRFGYTIAERRHAHRSILRVHPET